MLPPVALTVADRLIDAMMTVIDAVGARLLTAITARTDPGEAAETLFFRLTTLVLTLIRISNFGTRAPRAPNPDAPVRTPSAQPTRTAPTVTRPGWLLDALPDIAPILAADLAQLIADPAFVTLLDAAPTLNRTLRPLLRALGLTAPVSPGAPPPLTPPPPCDSTAPSPAAPPGTPAPRHRAPPRQASTPKPPPRSALFHA